MGPPVSAARSSRWAAHAGGHRASRASTASSSDALEQIDTPRGKYLACPQAAARQGDRRRAARRAGRCCATSTFPKQMHWDALARGRQGRAACSAGRSLAAVPLRRPRRPVHDPRAPTARVAARPGRASGAVTYGHRFLATSGRAGRAIKVRTFDEYQGALAENFVILSRDRAARPDRARARVAGAPARRPRAMRRSMRRPALLDEVPDLVEYPAVVAGAFARSSWRCRRKC